MPAFDLTFDIAHSLGAKRAAAALQHLDALKLERVTVESAGTVDIPGPGVVELRSVVTITDSAIHMQMTGTKPFHVFDKWIRANVLNQLEEALKGA